MKHETQFSYEMTDLTGEIQLCICEISADTDSEGRDIYVESLEFDSITLIDKNEFKSTFENIDALIMIFPRDELHQLYLRAEQKILSDRADTIEHYYEMRNDFN